MAVPYTHALALAAILFSIGLAGVLARRNLLFMLMSIEIMLNAAGLALVAAGAKWGQADGQVMLLFVLAAAAAEVAVGARAGHAHPSSRRDPRRRPPSESGSA